MVLRALAHAKRCFMLNCWKSGLLKTFEGHKVFWHGTVTSKGPRLSKPAFVYFKLPKALSIDVFPAKRKPQLYNIKFLLHRILKKIYFRVSILAPFPLSLAFISIWSGCPKCIRLTHLNIISFPGLWVTG